MYALFKTLAGDYAHSLYHNLPLKGAQFGHKHVELFYMTSNMFTWRYFKCGIYAERVDGTQCLKNNI